MKILYQHRTRAGDGQYVHIKELTEALQALGHEVIIVGPDNGQPRKMTADASKPVKGLKERIPGFLFELIELGYSALAFVKLWRAYRKHKPDVFYERYNLYFLAGQWLKRLTGIPMLVEVNSPLRLERQVHDGLSLPALADWSERTVWRTADYVLPVTDVLAGHVVEAGVSRDNICVIQNGVGDDFLNPGRDRDALRAELGVADKTVLGFTGFIRPWHGLDRVIRFLAEDPQRDDLHLVVVGDGPVREDLEQLADELGIADKVSFLGVKQRNEVARYMDVFDIALQPKVTDYASPLKLFEYMALGKAIVAPATDNILEVLSDGENALLFDPDNDDAFREAIKALCVDSGLAKRLGENARKEIEARDYTWRGNARRVVELFEGLSK